MAKKTAETAKPSALPRPLSHSSISMYQECPQKYKFKYIDKIPEKPRHFFSFGSSVHEALEFFYGGAKLPAPALKDVLAYYKEHWKSEGYKDERQEAEYFEEGKGILTNYYNKHIESFALPFFVEYNFSLEVDGVPVTGKVDRIDKLPDGRLAILDYKTGKAIPKDRVTADAQLTMYQMACEQLLDSKVAKLSFYHLPSLTETTIERHPQDLVDGLRRRVVTTAESIVKGAFEPKPDEKKCFWCDYKPICPIFKHQYSEVPKSASIEEEPDADLQALIDKCGRLAEELESVKVEISSTLKKKGYVRAFGKEFDATLSAATRWEFLDNKVKVLDAIKKAGLYERILAPSAPLVQQLMTDPKLDAALREKLEALGEKVEAIELKIKALSTHRR
jgi:putative RecB family exonuclease